MSDGARPRRARRRSVSRSESPQSMSTVVVPMRSSDCTTRQLPLEPLASEAKRSNLLQLLLQQREDALRGARVVGAAVLIEHVHLACSARLRHLNTVLLGLHLAVVGEKARKEAARILLELGIGVAHEVHALGAVAVLDGEADAVERKPDASPYAVEGLRHLELIDAIDAFRDLDARLRRGRGDLRARAIFLRAEAQHHAAQEFRLQLRVRLARLPARVAHVARRRIMRGGVDLFHAAVADVDLRAFAVHRALEPRAELVALRARIARVHRAAEEAADAGLRHTVAHFGPLRFHHAELRQLGLHQEAVLLPEILDRRPELLGRFLYDEPALSAGS